MSKKKFIAAGAALGLAATLFATAPAAQAEPVANGPVIVGSDTLQDVLNALTNGSTISGGNVRSTAGGAYAANFDAYGSTTIQPKTLGKTFGRPNGSSDGVKALSRSIDGQPYTAATAGSPTEIITGQVDVARSSAGATVNANGPLRYIPFGRDALTYAHSGGDNPVFANIDNATLKGLYECTITQINGTTIIPVVPQAGSGTRKDWVAKVGVTEASMLEVSEGGCVEVGQEHETRFLSNGNPFPANAITAMSAAQWVAQNTGAGVDRRGAGIRVGSPIAGVPAVTGTGASMTPNQAYYSDSHWGRDTYIVVENARVTAGDAKYSAALADLVSTSTSKLGNTASTLSSQAGSVKKKFGFLAPSTTTPFRAALS